jgi:1-deoxy-D-xylulose-5-phosphate reductoisomerase
MENRKKRQIAILGSTGSIGTQTLQVVEEHPECFEVYAITANTRVDDLIAQARKFMPEAVVIADDSKYLQLKEALQDLPIKVYGGYEAICQIVEEKPIDIVVTAMVGFSGLRPTINAIKAGKAIALANKETMVVAGEMINALAMEYKTPILPVDSEHSAIFQCLAGEMHNKVEKLILTASGGPFRTFTKEQLEHVTKEQALKHPNWSMGAKITIDSASMMNKGFEVMEAKWLFGVGAEEIEVVIHPQSVIHSMVQFEDGAVKAQLGTPDMRLPIMYALTYPSRLSSSFGRIDWSRLGELTFEKPDLELFPNLRHAYDALAKGGNIPCVVNAANEICVEAFLKERIKFTDMPRLIEKAMNEATYILKPSLEDYLETDRQTRRIVKEWIN